MTATAKITSKGQVTIPADVRRDLGVSSGDRIDFIRNAAGRYELSVRTGRLADLRGVLRGARTFTPEEIDGWVAEARAAMATEST